MVQNLWDDKVAGTFTTDLDQRVYTSRLLGQDPTLVMHGGGNTSVKAKVTNILGEEEEILYVKGSGWDLATIEPQGFAPVRMPHLLKLRRLERLPDPEMVNELKTQLLDHKAPGPSVETLLHAFLPHKFVDHTHADAVLTLTNQPGGEGLIRELYGDPIAIVPYIMPGFALAKLCAEIYQQNQAVAGMILLQHGVFSFGSTARESYDRMIAIVQKAEEVVAKSRRPPATQIPKKAPDDLRAWWMLQVRSELRRRGQTFILQLDDSPEALEFCGRDDLNEIATRGPLTPDHIIRTKKCPLVLSASAVASRDLRELANSLDRYREAYEHYFKAQSARYSDELQMLDPLPRVFLIPGVGVVSAGDSKKEAAIVSDIYRHTMPVIAAAEGMSRYQALPEDDLFDMEYWVLEQAKLKLGPKKLPLSGKVVAITGGASGIGLGIARELASAGACILNLDRNGEVEQITVREVAPLAKSGNGVFGVVCDVTKAEQVDGALQQAILKFGGLDAVVVNAGIFPPTALIADIDDKMWEQSLAVNATGSMCALRSALRIMKEQGTGGDIVVVASKNVPAPGKGAACYSAAKAAQNQLARVAALEGASFGVRVNMLHPHLVLDTGIWNDQIIADRAKAYGLTPEEYKTNNLLKTAIKSADVATAVHRLLDGSFAKTTGAQIAIDGGSDRTI